MNKQGLLLCAKYSVAPNYFGYCGPDKNLNLIDHLKENIVDKEIEHILSEFETLYLYLNLIAKENKIIDPFDSRVVEAYWVGNSLLDNLSNRNYAYFIQEKLQMDKKLGKKYQNLKQKILTHKFYPHHNFHVFNIFKRTGKDPSFHTLETMDECRIAYGKFKAKSLKRKVILIETKPLIIEKNKIKIGNLITREIKIDYKGKRFIKELNVGDWVSFHWGFVCDILTDRQVKNLEHYTKKALEFYNY